MLRQACWNKVTSQCRKSDKKIRGKTRKKNKMALVSPNAVYSLGCLLGTGKVESLSGDRFWGGTATDSVMGVGKELRDDGAALCSVGVRLSMGTQRRLAADVGNAAASLLSVLVLLVSSTNEDGTLTLPGDFSNRCDGMSRILCVNMCCFMLPCNSCSIRTLKLYLQCWGLRIRAVISPANLFARRGERDEETWSAERTTISSKRRVW